MSSEALYALIGLPNFAVSIAIDLFDGSYGTHGCRIVISLRCVAAQSSLHADQLTDPALVFGQPQPHLSGKRHSIAQYRNRR
jgi:hypothetical protein